MKTTANPVTEIIFALAEIRFAFPPRKQNYLSIPVQTIFLIFLYSTNFDPRAQPSLDLSSIKEFCW